MINILGKLETSHHGLMIGNGEIGALIYGDKFLSIALDRVDLWDERMPSVFFRNDFNYENLSNLLINNYAKSYEIFDACYLHPYPTKLNAGTIVTDIEVSDKDRSSIDPLKGLISYNAKNNKVKNAFVDAKKNVIVIDFDKAPSFTFKTPQYFHNEEKDGGLGYEKGKIIKDGDFSILKQKIYNNNVFYVLVLKKESSLYITIRKDSLLFGKIELLNYVKNRGNNFKKHLCMYNNYFNESNVKLPDEKLNNEYLLGRYYFFANSSKKYPMTLHGVWTNADGKLPSWKSDYHNDLNLQMSYESYLKNGNYKEGKVLLDYLVNRKRQFKLNSKKFLKAKGLYIPGVMTNQGKPLGGWPQYALNPATELWLIKAFDEYYNYLQNNKYLKRVIFPFYKGIEKSLRTILKKDENGYYSFAFHSSPEFFENDQKSIFKYQTNFEIISLRFFYLTLCKYCKILGRNDSEYKTILNNLSPLVVNDNCERMISKDQEFNMSHRHFSHILDYKNFELTDTFEKTNLELLKKDIARIEKFGHDKWAGFSYIEMIGLCSLIYDGETSYKYLNIFVDSFIHDNGFHMNNDFKNFKNSKLDCYVMTLEANIGFVKSVNDTLLKTFGKKVCIFPAISKEIMENGLSFDNLRTQNNHKVSASINNKLLSFKIDLSKPDIIYLENNFVNNPVIKVDGKNIEFKSTIGQLIQIEAKESISYKQNALL